jgi:hypothetical protein
MTREAYVQPRDGEIGRKDGSLSLYSRDLEQRHSFAKSSADLRPAFMHGALPLSMLVPSPEHLKAAGEN